MVRSKKRNWKKKLFLATQKLVLGTTFWAQIPQFGPESCPPTPPPQLTPRTLGPGWRGARPEVEATPTKYPSDRRRPQCTSSGCLRRQHRGPIRRYQILSHLACTKFAPGKKKLYFLFVATKEDIWLYAGNANFHMHETWPHCAVILPHIVLRKVTASRFSEHGVNLPSFSNPRESVLA